MSRPQFVPAFHDVPDLHPLFLFEPRRGFSLPLPGFAPQERPILTDELVFISGRSMAGKSRLVMQMVSDAIEQGYSVLVVTYEQSRKKWEDIALAREARIDSRHFVRGIECPDLAGRAREALDQIDTVAYRERRNSHVFYLEPPPDVDALLDMASRAVKWRPNARWLLIIDAVHNVTVRGAGDRRGEVDHVINGAKAFAGEYQTPVICVAHENADGGFKETGHALYSADVVARLEFEDGASPVCDVVDALGNNCTVWPRTLTLTKYKDGESGARRHLLFTPALGTFEEEAFGE